MKLSYENEMPEIVRVIIEGTVEELASLLEKGANPNVEFSISGIGYPLCVTPLHYACHQFSPEKVDLLIKAGAEVNTKTGKNQSPIFHILKTCNFWQEEFEKSGGLRPQLLDQSACRRFTSLEELKKCGELIAQRLFDKGSDFRSMSLRDPSKPIDLESNPLMSPLYYALRLGFNQLSQKMLSAGVPHIDQRFDPNGITVLMVAAVKDDISLETLTKIIEAGADLNVKSLKTAGTAVQFAITVKNLPKVKLLVQAGSDLSLEDSKGYTPLTYANLLGAHEIANYLRSCENGESKAEAETNLTKVVSDFVQEHADDFSSNNSSFPDLINILKQRYLKHPKAATLNLSRCFSARQLQDPKFSDVLFVVVAALQQCPHIKKLDLSHNSFDTTQIEKIVRGLAGNKFIISIDFSDCSINPERAELVGLLMSPDANSISQFIMNANPLGDLGVEKFHSLIACNYKLSTLHLESCNITDSGAAILLSALQNNSRLFKMNLKGNRISQETEAQIRVLTQQNSRNIQNAGSEEDQKKAAREFERAQLQKAEQEDPSNAGIVDFNDLMNGFTDKMRAYRGDNAAEYGTQLLQQLREDGRRSGLAPEWLLMLDEAILLRMQLTSQMTRPGAQATSRPNFDLVQEVQAMREDSDTDSDPDSDEILKLIQFTNESNRNAELEPIVPEDEEDKKLVQFEPVSRGNEASERSVPQGREGDDASLDALGALLVRAFGGQSLFDDVFEDEENAENAVKITIDECTIEYERCKITPKTVIDKSLSENEKNALRRERSLVIHAELNRIKEQFFDAKAEKKISDIRFQLLNSLLECAKVQLPDMSKKDHQKFHAVMKKSGAELPVFIEELEGLGAKIYTKYCCFFDDTQKSDLKRNLLRVIFDWRLESSHFDNCSASLILWQHNKKKECAESDLCLSPLRQSLLNFLLEFRFNDVLAEYKEDLTQEFSEMEAMLRCTRLEEGYLVKLIEAEYLQSDSKKYIKNPDLRARLSSLVDECRSRVMGDLPLAQSMAYVSPAILAGFVSYIANFAPSSTVLLSLGFSYLSHSRAERMLFQWQFPEDPLLRYQRYQEEGKVSTNQGSPTF